MEEAIMNALKEMRQENAVLRALVEENQRVAIEMKTRLEDMERKAQEQVSENPKRKDPVVVAHALEKDANVTSTVSSSSSDASQGAVPNAGSAKKELPQTPGKVKGPRTPSKKTNPNKRDFRKDRGSLLGNDGSPAATALKKLQRDEDEALQVMTSGALQQEEESDDDDEAVYDKEEEKIFQKTICGKPPVFTGRNHRMGEATSWLTLVEQILDAVKILTEEKRVQAAATYLREDALQWYQSFQSSIKNFDDFKESFLANFEQVDLKEQAWKEFYGLEQGNMKVAEYQRRFNAVANLLPDLDEKVKIQRFVYGLKPRLRDHLLENNYTDSFVTASSAALRKGRYEEGNSGQGKGGSSFLKFDNSKKNIECFNCGRRGHKKEDCRLPPRQQGPKPGMTKPWEKKHLAAMDVPEVPPPAQQSATTPTVPKPGNC